MAGLPCTTEAEGESYLEPAAGPDQEPGAVVATSDPSVAPLHLGEAERGSPGTRRAASAVSENRATAPGVSPGTAQGGLEPGGDGDLLGGPQQRGGRELLHRYEWRQSPAEKGRRRTHLWWRSRRARRGTKAQKKR